MADAKVKQLQKDFNVHSSNLGNITSRLNDVVGRKRRFVFEATLNVFVLGRGKS
jgi:hypothetical protein